MKLARQISSAGNLGPSISETLGTLTAPPVAKPKKPLLAVIEPEPIEPPGPDDAAVIEQLEIELSDARERVAIMEEAADPKSRKQIDTINNQRELVRTLKASVADWQSKASAARKENGALKRKITRLEAELGRCQHRAA